MRKSLVKSSERLGIVTEELEGGEHSKTSVLELSGLTLGKNIRGEVNNSSGRSEPPISLDASNEGDDLGPSEEGDGGHSSKTIGDIAGAD